MIEVYDDDDTHEAIAAAVAGRPEFKAAATKVYAEIKAEAAAHLNSGQLAASIHLNQGKVDWAIEADTDYDAHAEFGHYVWLDQSGNVVKRGQGVRKVWVDGVGVFRNVVAANGGY